jgi:hypothetical protein
MEAIGENPTECMSQPELDKYSELGYPRLYRTTLDNRNKKKPRFLGAFRTALDWLGLPVDGESPA